MFVYVRYILNRAVGRSENSGGGGNFNVLGIYRGVELYKNWHLGMF